MSVKPREALQQINHYVAAKSIDSVKRELGIDQVLKLAGNENAFGYSSKVKEAINRSLDGLSFYPDMNCTALKEKLCDIYQVGGNNLIFGNGSFELITLIAQTYIESGDEVIYIDPSFNWYRNVTLQMGGVIVNVPLDHFQTDLNRVLESVTDKTRVIWLCNPNNPAGTIVTSQNLEKFLEQLPKDILLVLDEAYIDFVQEADFPNSISLLNQYENIIILRTFSKLYGLASFRIGFGIAPESVIQNLNKVRIPINVSTLAQTAALASLEDEAFKNQVLENNRKSSQLYYTELEKLGLKYVKTNCNFILFDTGLDSNKVAEKYLKRGIIIRAGAEFGLPTWVRITIGKWDENELVLSILKEILKEDK